MKLNPRVLLVGLAVVAPLVAVLLLNLGRDPHVIGSPLVGRAAPEFALRPLDGGEPVTLASLRGTPAGPQLLGHLVRALLRGAPGAA